MKQYDVIVIGGGHAGTEAADAAARMNAATALVTLSEAAIGVMSCNPAIGGLGKGHLVREIDALDGLMARTADAAGIQFRLLNRSKGPAVQGPRAQADRKVYRETMRRLIAGRPGLDVIQGEVVDLKLSGGRLTGVILADGTALAARAVVLTTGTFLRGMIHIGDRQIPAGRMGEAPSLRLADRLADLAVPLGRLKTGTPPRLDGRTIDWDKVAWQPGDESPVMFSFMSERPPLRQVSCGVTQTNAQTHDIIRANLHRSAMYGGRIDSVGPRYCPSIEDKVVRFADKDSHQVFLEPEGLDDDTVYPNGISCSLPEDVQDAYVRSIRGLERVAIRQPGYAIEYDHVDPRALTATLEMGALPGLFLAGQINGTTGYEEAAAQGLVAGLNAALLAQDRPAFSFSRADSYIGVMVDDLVTRGVSEPYRMFTSRAEYRLQLRADNADQRLTPLGVAVGCVSAQRREVFDARMEALSEARGHLAALSVTPQQASAIGLHVRQDGVRRNGMDLLAFPGVTFEHLIGLDGGLEAVSTEARRQVEREALYARYIARQAADVAALRRDEAQALPLDLAYRDLPGLSAELQAKLEAVRPATLAQAARVEGMTPAALTLILAHLRHKGRRMAG